MRESPLKQRLARLGLAPARLYLRRVPLRAGKQWFWDHVVRPHLLWRPFTVQAVTRTGLRLHGRLSDTIHGSLYFFGVWEPALTRYLAEQLVDGDVFIDVGANVGIHTMMAAQRVGATGRVHAIEASASTYAILRANLAANRLGNVVTHHCAAAAESGTVALYLHDPSNIGATSMGARGPEPQAQESVEARPLPLIVPPEDLRRARVIKIDVEGAEWLVCRGLEPCLHTLRPDASIVVEVDRHALQRHGASLAALLGLFAAHGFTPMRLADHSARLCIEGAPGLLPVPADFDIADLVFRRAS